MNDGLDYEIEEKTKEVNGMWEDLSELASARREALAGAKKVHAFDKKIDDTLEWILEKEALLSVEINCQDSEAIQDLKHRQIGLKQDVKAINDQVWFQPDKTGIRTLLSHKKLMIDIRDWLQTADLKSYAHSQVKSSRMTIWNIK